MKLIIAGLLSFAVLTAAASLAGGQVNIQGIVNTAGVINMPSQAGTHQYTHIWAFAPPNGPDGAADNYNFYHNVMGNPSIDGVSLLEAWNQIEIAAPTPTPCTPSDTCQPDPVALGMYHTYDWTSTAQSYDSVAPNNPVFQWLQLGKKVNLLITGEASGSINPETPHYVTSAAWYNLFNPTGQDVINGLKDCTGSSAVWAGTAATSASYASGSNLVTVNLTGCCSTGASQSSLVQDGDLVWTTVPSPATTCGTGSAGARANVGTSADSFTYTPSGACSNAGVSGAGVTYVSAAQSWAVPYEYPYKNALKAFWAAVVAHYGPSFSLTPPGGSLTNYFPQLNYFRFGGSVGSEWYPYCTTSLRALTDSPYTYVKQVSTEPCPAGLGTCTGWIDYYQEMGNYLQSLGPALQVIHSINAADSPQDYTYGSLEAALAVTWANRYGWRDGFGSQGLSVQDYLSCSSGGCPVATCVSPTTCSASNWYPLFGTYGPQGVPLELQPIALSNYSDGTCSPACTPNTDSGDLRVFLPFADSPGGATDFEIYWRDLSLAYDYQNYCALNAPPPLPTNCVAVSVTLGGQINSVMQENDFFQNVGQGTTTGHMYCGGPFQSRASGDCSYAHYITNAHGQH